MPESPDETRSRILRETHAIHHGIVIVTTAWASLENSFALLLGSLLQDPGNFLASAIYFAPSNTDTRIAIVSATMRAALGGHPHFAKIESAWARLINSVNRKKNVRNQVAHGEITTIHMKGKNHVRLTSPIFDFLRSGIPIQKGQLPGLSGHDIAQSAEAIVELRKQLDIWLAIISVAHAADDTSLLEKLAQLPTDQS